jgi:hypothetical protein
VTAADFDSNAKRKKRSEIKYGLLFFLLLIKTKYIFADKRKNMEYNNVLVADTHATASVCIGFTAKRSVTKKIISVFAVNLLIILYTSNTLIRCSNKLKR